MSVINKLLLAVISLTTLLATPWCLADDVPINACAQYLSASDNSFYSLVASNNSAATNAAQALGACQSANACAEINGIDNCGSILANRFFVSEYYAIVSSNGASSSYGSAGPSPTKSVKIMNSVNIPDTSNTTKNNSSNKDNSIHWF